MTYEFEGKTEKEAIETAAKELGLREDKFDVEILETQKTGFFKKGFVKIRVHLDDGSERISSETQIGKKSIFQSKKTQNRGQNTRPRQRNMPPIQRDAEVKEQKALEPQGDFEINLVDFVQTLIEKMGYKAKVDICSREGNKIGLVIQSDDSSILIGRKGKNLDALQLLSNVYAGRQGRQDTKVILDTQNYRIKREESLVRLAYNMADKVRYTKRSILLDPMNPYERRIVHTALNDSGDVETKSEGEGLYKQVRVIYTGNK